MTVQQGGIESWQSSPSPVERGLFMLDVPGLKKAEKSVSLWASVFKQPKHNYIPIFTQPRNLHCFSYRQCDQARSTIMPPLMRAHYWDPPSLINRQHLVIRLIKIQVRG